jgi:hypothetical protein
MASTYEPITTQTLSSAVAAVTISSIPATYTDLVLVMSFGATNSIPSIHVRLNGDSAGNYSAMSMEGAGTSPASQRQSNAAQMVLQGFQGGSYTSPFINIIHFNNYANTTTYKTVLSRHASNATGAYVGLWRSTSAITSVTITHDYLSTFTAGSTFTLYGIKAA